MIAIIDYGMGNLRSVQKALEAVGAEAKVVSTPLDISKANKLVLPGVGACKPAMDRLVELKLAGPIKEFVKSGKPFLGICLGYQLLFDSCTEGGFVKTLGVIPGTVERFPDTVKVPQMGWNSLQVTPNGQPVFAGVQDGAFVYFCHSYYAKPADEKIVASWTDYGLRYASSVRMGNVWGVQFHPEKSQAVGLVILKNFVSS
jgi:imidazole glycerol-phosphate synthase subunit HisH